MVWRRRLIPVGPSSTRASSRFIDSEATAPPPPPGLDLTAHTQALILGPGTKNIRSGIRGARFRNSSPSCRLKGGCGAAPHSHCVAHFLGNSSTFLQSLSVPPTTHLASARAIFPRRSSLPFRSPFFATRLFTSLSLESLIQDRGILCIDLRNS